MQILNVAKILQGIFSAEQAHNIMKCPKCNKELKISIASKADCAGCKMLTSLTSIATVQCENCKHVFQAPIQSKSFLGVKKYED